ncbi:diversity-generating retroelement protein Avd [Nostoc linckia FACHB-104]|nr:diversity-generating retroelement protein Avd [Nostoc linckia FACHB-104]
MLTCCRKRVFSHCYWNGHSRYLIWYVPIIERLPKIHKFTLGDRIINQLYDLLEGLVKAKYAKDKLPQLESLNTQLDILRYQTRMLLDFEKMSVERYEYAIKIIDEIGTELGGWIKKQRDREK